MAYTTIDDPSAYFHTQLYTGDGASTNAITNDANAGDFQPDWIWIKRRDGADNHHLFDTSRGITKELNTNGTACEGCNHRRWCCRVFYTLSFIKIWIKRLRFARKK